MRKDSKISNFQCEIACHFETICSFAYKAHFLSEMNTKPVLKSPTSI